MAAHRNYDLIKNEILIYVLDVTILKNVSQLFIFEFRCIKKMASRILMFIVMKQYIFEYRVGYKFNIKKVSVILVTACYCLRTVEKLEIRLKSEVKPASLSKDIDFLVEIELFIQC